MVRSVSKYFQAGDIYPTKFDLNVEKAKIEFAVGSTTPVLLECLTTLFCTAAGSKAHYSFVLAGYTKL